MPNERPTLNDILGQFGLSVPKKLNDNVIFPDSGWFKRHPKITRTMENALLAAAGTKGGETVGESISNVAAGVMGVPQARENIQMQRLMKPFQMAGPAMELLTGQAKLEGMQADVGYKADLGLAAREQAKWYGARAEAEGEEEYGIIRGTGGYTQVPKGGGEGIFHEYDPRFGAPSRGGASTSPGYWKALRDLESPDPTTRASADAMLKAHGRVQSLITGGRTGAGLQARFGETFEGPYQVPSSIRDRISDEEADLEKVLPKLDDNFAVFKWAAKQGLQPDEGQRVLEGIWKNFREWRRLVQEGRLPSDSTPDDWARIKSKRRMRTNELLTGPAGPGDEEDLDRLLGGAFPE